MAGRVVLIRKSVRARERGVSLLLEAALGLGIFTVALLMLFAVFPLAHRSLTQARNHEIATNLAKDFLEQELRKDYDSVQNLASPIQVIVPATSDGVNVSLRFNISIEVDEVATSPPDLYSRKNVVIRASYLEGLREGKVTLETAIFK